jgi:hypothetical protein
MAGTSAGRRAALKVILSSVLILSGGMFPAGTEVRLPTQPRRIEGPDLSLLLPIRDVLSSRPWLLLSGKDPELLRAPEAESGSEAEGGGAGSGVSAPSAPALQGPGGFLVPFRNPAPAFSRDVLISRDFSDFPVQTEPHVAVDPADPDHIVVAMIDYNSPSVTDYLTFDGGLTWEGPFQTGYLPDDLGSGGDPVLSFDREGNLFLATISIGEEEFTVGPVFTSSLVSSIAVSRSKDGGYSWPSIVATARSTVTIASQQIDPQGRLRGSVQIGFLDKPWLAVGPNPAKPAEDVIYVGYVEFIEYYDIIYTGELPILLPREVATTIKLVRSEDKGLTWSDPFAVSPTVRRSYGIGPGVGLPGESLTDRVLQGPRPEVAGDGTLYVAWFDSTDDGSMKGLAELVVTRSSDGGKTFSVPQTAVVFNEIPFRPRNAFFRYWASGFPKLAAGAGGELYMAFSGRPAENPRDDGDVLFIRSSDRGTSWSKPQRLNNEKGDSLQFFPEIDVGPDGTLHAMWADMRDDPSQVRYHIYYSRSVDGGKTWGFESKELGFNAPDVRVTDFSSNPNRAFPSGLFIGDYFGMAATKGDVYIVWADSRLAEFGGVNQKIGFARQRAIRPPDIFISPAAGAGGQSVTIQGFYFQPDMNVMIQLSDSVIATARTNAEGRFNASVYMPVTGEGAQTLRAFDESGNLASTSYYTEFGFGSMEKLYRQLLDEVRNLGKAPQK